MFRESNNRMWVSSLLVFWVAVLPGSAAFSGPGPTARGKQSRSSEELPVKAVDILELDKDMASFLVRHVSPKQSPSQQVADLMDAVFGKKGLRIKYDVNATMTAAETFKARSGNCMSFTILFVAMARHIGLDAYFKEVSEVISWDRRGEIIVRNQHMIVEVEIENGHEVVDFLPEAEKRYRAVRRISDERALAHYYNNLGVEALAAKDPERALRFFEFTLAADPEFSYGWTNAGVAHRRSGDFEAAERSHLRALEIDKNGSAAMTNLASLYIAWGREEQAAPWRRQVNDDLKRNPFHHFGQGVAKARSEDWTESVKSFREAIRRMPDEAEFHAALAQALAGSGDLDRARDSLSKALSLATDEEARARLEKDYGRLERKRSRFGDRDGR